MNPLVFHEQNLGICSLPSIDMTDSSRISKTSTSVLVSGADTNASKMCSQLSQASVLQTQPMTLDARCLYPGLLQTPAWLMCSSKATSLQSSLLQAPSSLTWTPRECCSFSHLWFAPLRDGFFTPKTPQGKTAVPAWHQVNQFSCFHMHPKWTAALENPFLPLLSPNTFSFLFNFFSQLNTLENVKVFLICYSSEKSYHQMACTFSSNIVHASAPASPSVVAGGLSWKREWSCDGLRPIQLYLTLVQPLLPALLVRQLPRKGIACICEDVELLLLRKAKEDGFV